VYFAARHVRAQRRDVELDIRPLRIRHHARKQAALIDAAGERSTPVKQPFKADPHATDNRVSRLHSRIGLDVIN
jgi:hypothetical protein